MLVFFIRVIVKQLLDSYRLTILIGQGFFFPTRLAELNPQIATIKNQVVCAAFGPSCVAKRAIVAHNVMIKT